MMLYLIHMYFQWFLALHLPPNDMFKLGKLIDEKLENQGYDGVVITHGTDTLEETAYFFGCILTNKKASCVNWLNA